MGSEEPQRKVTDFSIRAIMAERDQLSKDTATQSKVFRKPVKIKQTTILPRKLSPPSISPQPEIPDTTTSDEPTALPIALKNDSPSFCSELANVQCNLEMKELWEKFNELGTEMIITRSGRRMFPTLRVSFSGLETKATYLVLLDIVSVDSKQYRYAYHRSSWLVAGKGDPQPKDSKLYSHPDSPFSGEQLRKQMITFEKVKLTNTEVNKPGYIVLNSMHRYQPRIHLVVDRVEEPIGKSLKTFADLDKYDHKTFIFPECAFYSVTAYQNQLITKLKIDCNPFAKGFRDSTRVVSDMERDSLSDCFAPSYAIGGAADYDRSPFSPKPPGFLPLPLFTDGGHAMAFKAFQPVQSSIPMNVLQKWTWPLTQPPQSSLMELQRNLLIAKHLAAARMQPRRPEERAPLQRITDDGTSIS